MGVEIGRDNIRANFKLTPKQAKSSPRWDPKRRRVMMELLDGEGRTIFEQWVKVPSDRYVKAALVLQER